MLLTHPSSQNIDMTGWKIVIGGSALPRAKAALDGGIDIFCGYGMSETCPLLTSSHLSPAMLAATPDEQIDIRTSKFGTPERLLFVETLPKTSVGKLDKKVLRQTYGDG